MSNNATARQNGGQSPLTPVQQGVVTEAQIQRIVSDDYANTFFHADVIAAEHLSEKLWEHGTRADALAIKKVLRHFSVTKGQLEAIITENKRLETQALKLETLLKESRAETEEVGVDNIQLSAKLGEAKTRHDIMEKKCLYSEESFARLAQAVNERSLLVAQADLLTSADVIDTLVIVATKRIVSMDELSTADVNELFDLGFIAMVKAGGYIFYSMTDAGDKLSVYLMDRAGRKAK